MAAKPTFPTIGLPEALGKVKKLYDEAHRRKLSRVEVAKNLGYGSLNGRSAVLIANLTKYGLLDGRGDEIRVSDDAVAILIEERGAADRAAALRRVAYRPELFADLLSQFEGGPAPSENAVRIRLEKLGYLPQAAREGARAFRETIELVEMETGAYNESGAESSDEAGHEDFMQTQPSPPSISPTVPVTHPAHAVPSLPMPATGYKQDVFSLDEGEAIIRWPEGLSKNSYDDFKGWLELVLRKIARSVREE